MDASTQVKDIIGLEEFKDFGRFLFPAGLSDADLERPLDQIAPLFPWQRHIDTATTVAVLNDLQTRAGQHGRVFCDIYSPEEKEQDPSKKDTGIFFYRGVSCGPFAIICPGGSFSYVGSLHESLPHALKLSKQGYNVFAPHYRQESLEAACEDLAAAITRVFEDAFDLSIDTECYALWGSSVGAHIAAYLSSYGPHAFGGHKLPRPGTLVMQYSNHTNHTRQEPPTFVCVGANDPVCDWHVMKNRLDALDACGIDTEFHKYDHLGHGFGLGIGTDAEGWIKLAAAFWRRHLPARARRVLRRVEETTGGA